jgi:hypothetical protein
LTDRTSNIFVGIVIVCLALPSATQAQLTRVDSMLAASLGAMLPSNNGVVALLTGDSTYAPLIAAVPRTVASSAPLYHVSQLTAIVRRTDSGARMDISVQGELLQPMNSLAMPCTLSRTVPVQLSENDSKQVEANATRYVRFTPASGGFWSNTLEPILVVLGAVAVVALFFIIRS